MASNSIYLLLSVILTLFVTHVHGLVFVQTINGTGFTLQSTEIIYIGLNRTKISEPISAEITTNRSDVYNKFYLIQTSLSIDEYVVEVQNNGAIAVLSATTTTYAPGLLKYRFTDQKYVRQVNIPILELGKAEGNTLMELYNSGQIDNVTLIPSDDLNEWEEVFTNPGFMTWTVFNMAFSATNMALAIWKLVLFVKFYGGFKTSIACYVLLIELISNATAYNPLPTRVSSFLLVLSFPFSFASYLLFTLYWHEIMTSSAAVVHPFIVKMRIPFYVICALLLALNFASLIIVYTTEWDGLSFFNTIASVVLQSALIVFYAVTVVKLLKRIKQSKASGRRVHLRKTTIKVIIGIGFLFAFIVLAVIFLSGLTLYPISYAICISLVYTFLNAAAMMNILAFEVLPDKSSKSNPSSKKTASNGASSNVRDSTVMESINNNPQP